MDFRPSGAREDEEPEINLIALIDVLLMTLIFLLVTTSFSKEARLSIKLPSASQQAAQPAEAPLEIAIDEQGRYYVGGNELVNSRPETLQQALQQLAAGHKDQSLVIRADARTPHHFVVIAMDAAARLGLVRLSIATTQTQD
ncbi:MAG TPA: biopolymer transporter ExbD [Gammaproteobacteria bacterium]|nr:biopolymer transporter ExbD [Gammaproteobacteria bacterium]